MAYGPGAEFNKEVRKMALEGHVVFNGQSRLLKLFIKGGAELGKPDGLLHTLNAHDVGVNDQYISAGQDEYGSRCKCPPGDYGIGAPMQCATRNADGSVTKHNDDDQAYGCWFTPLIDSHGNEAEHGRAGIGIHGGGSDLPNPFALQQGWEYTLGCIRLQNEDNENVFVPFVKFIQAHSGIVTLSVVWP